MVRGFCEHLRDWVNDLFSNMAANWKNEPGSLRIFSVFWNTHRGNVEFVCLAPVVVAEEDNLEDWRRRKKAGDEEEQDKDELKTTTKRKSTK